MPEAAEPIALQPLTHSDQLARPANAPSPQVATPLRQAQGGAPATLPPAPTIAVDGSTHADVVKAVWSTAMVNDFPDGNFLYVEAGDKDGEGKTTPRSKRHFPYKDASGKVDLPHLRNAIARIPQSNAPGLTPEKKTALQERARKMLESANKEMGEMYNDAPVGYSPLYGVTSFAELDDMEAAYEASCELSEMTSQYQMMVGNIMQDQTILNKPAAIQRLSNEFTGRMQQAMKPKEKPGIVERIISVVTGKKEKPAETIEPHVEPVARPGLTLWKENGAWRWLAIYSNNYRDQDNPPEIISEKSHKSFLGMVDEGYIDYPELWHWHTPGTAWGKADWLDYADGFAVASGYVYPGHEKEAESVSQLGDIRVSHGMPSRFIVRSKEDPTIIDFHVTTEISDLPGYAAANPLTEFAVLNSKESDMAFTPEKRQYLVQAGLSEDAIKELEGNLAQKAQAAANAGLESKETAPPATPPAEVPATSTSSVTEPEYATRQEVAAAVADALKPLVDAIALMAGEVKALKESDEAKIAKAAAATPRASLQELIAANIIGNPAAVVDGRTALAKAAPKQAQTEATGYTASPLLNGLMHRSQGGAA